jgi:hypothetical protein
MMSEGWKVLYLHTEDPRLHEDLPCGPQIDQRSGSHKKVSSRDSTVTRGLSSSLGCVFDFCRIVEYRAGSRCAPAPQVRQ